MHVLDGVSVLDLDGDAELVLDADDEELDVKMRCWSIF